MGKSDCFCGLFSSLKKQNSQLLATTNPLTFRDDEPIAMAEAAVSAAQKAIDIAKQTSRARKCHVVLGHSFEERAAVVIQARFRSYLARRALRALKSLVKLQALVRGNIVRKQSAEKLRRMQALLRAQSRACAGRAQISESPSSSTKSAQFCHPGPETPEKFEYVIRSNSITRDQSPMSKKIGLTPTLPKRKNLFHSTHLSVSSDQYSHSFGTSINSTTHQTLPSLSSYEVRSFSPSKVTEDIDESPFCTAENSPHFSRKGPLTPTKSDGSKSCLSGYSDNPSYMASTKSSKAKTRSLSAPKQRPPIERPCSARRYLVYNYEEMKTAAQRGSAIHASFVNKAYPGSGRLDRLGLPVMNDGYVYRY